ncbi:MAG: hypothetical protein U0S36_02590, partial [Candidatus Nanopelagicales bacterium]
MTVAELRPAAPTDAAPYSPLDLERCLTRINEQLVLRTGSDAWWSSLGRSLDELATALRRHAEETGGSDGLHGQILEHEPRLAFEVRGLERDHVDLAADVRELQALVAASPGQPGAVPRTLAATTEVVARIRGHQRRLGTVLHEAYQRDLGD